MWIGPLDFLSIGPSTPSVFSASGESVYLSNANSASAFTVYFLPHGAVVVLIAWIPLGTCQGPLGCWIAPGVCHGPLGCSICCADVATAAAMATPKKTAAMGSVVFMRRDFAAEPARDLRTHAGNVFRGTVADDR